MSEILSRFSFSAAKFNSQVLAALILVWLVVLLTALSSIFAQPFTTKQRIFWILLVVFLPVLGLLIYLPFSVTDRRNPIFFGIGGKK